MLRKQFNEGDDGGKKGVKIQVMTMINTDYIFC